MEIYPKPNSEITAEGVLMKFLERAPIIFRMDRTVAITWAINELKLIQEPEQLLLFKGEDR